MKKRGKDATHAAATKRCKRGSGVRAYLHLDAAGGKQVLDFSSSEQVHKSGVREGVRV